MVRIGSEYFRFWRELTRQEKAKLKSQMFALFPEILKPQTNDKYDGALLWLVEKKQIICPSFRDLFTAGGVSSFEFQQHTYRIPKICLRIEKQSQNIIDFILDENNLNELNKNWGTRYNGSLNALKHWKRQMVTNLSQHPKIYNTSFPVRDFINHHFPNA